MIIYIAMNKGKRFPDSRDECSLTCTVKKKIAKRTPCKKTKQQEPISICKPFETRILGSNKTLLYRRWGRPFRSRNKLPNAVYDKAPPNSRCKAIKPNKYKKTVVTCTCAVTKTKAYSQNHRYRDSS